MPHVRENEPRPDDVPPRDQPSEGIDGNPINPGETVAREDAPGPGGETRPPKRQADAVEGEPGSDL